jgi:hypothetical protein
MNKFRTWREYLDNKGKLVEKPEEKEVADYDGPDPKSPEKPVTKGKNWDAKAPKGDEPKPYRASSKDSTPKKGEKGFADEGPKDLVYTPDTKVKKKSKTEQFLDTTKDMTLSEFTNHMLKECGCANHEEDDDLPMVTAYTSGKFHPHPPEAIRYVAVLANKNNRILDNFIHEMKRNNGLTKFLESLLDHPESYSIIADLLSHDEQGPSRTKKFTRAMDDVYTSFLKNHEDIYESVTPPFGVDAEEEEKEEEEDNGTETEDADSGNELGTDAVADMNQLGDAPKPDESPDEENGEMDSDGDNSSAMPKKIKKRFAEDHLIEAMTGHDRMKEKMKHYMGY